ncbi:MAG: radical SAM protein [Nanoarchaeota archaeon]
MTAKLTLIKPEIKFPVKKQGYAGDVGIPLGLLYLAGYVQDRNGTHVRVIDYRLNKALGIPRNLEQDLRDSDVVGIGACTAESPDSLAILRKAKEMGKITVMGGLYPTFNADVVLRTGAIDYVIFGEGEEGLSKVLRVAEGTLNKTDLKGVAFRDGDNIVRMPDKELIKDLDTIPLPAYDLVPVEEYAKMSPAGIYAARGCPMACDHCTLNELWEYRYRRRSIENILAELEMLNGFGFKRVHFKDETITLNGKWCAELFGAIEQANLGLNYKAKSRIDGIKPDLIRQMVAAGVDTIHTGVESVSQAMLDAMDKGVKARTIRGAFDVLLESGCKVNPVYMFGYPGETPETLAENAVFIEETGRLPGVITYISFITPHPGSGFERNMAGELRVLSADYNRYTHKQPVATPTSLGRNGVRLMVDHYHHIAEAIGMQEVNPAIDPLYLEEIIDKDQRNDIQVIRTESTCHRPSHRRATRHMQLTVNGA